MKIVESFREHMKVLDDIIRYNCKFLVMLFGNEKPLPTWEIDKKLQESPSGLLSLNENLVFTNSYLFIITLQDGGYYQQYSLSLERAADTGFPTSHVINGILGMLENRIGLLKKYDKKD
jgi:hypothetical protein